MKLELAFDAAPFIRSDQALMRIADRMERAFKPGLPEIQEPVHLRKIGCQIVVLPDIGLQHGFEIRNAIEDVRGGEAVAIELTFQIR